VSILKRREFLLISTMALFKKNISTNRVCNEIQSSTFFFVEHISNNMTQPLLMAIVAIYGRFSSTYLILVVLAV
jgi:hypothetical protein